MQSPYIINRHGKLEKYKLFFIQRLAASMAQPFRTRRDYQSIGRRVFLVDQLPDGALPIYDRGKVDE